MSWTLFAQVLVLTVVGGLMVALIVDKARGR